YDRCAVILDEMLLLGQTSDEIVSSLSTVYEAMGVSVPPLLPAATGSSQWNTDLNLVREHLCAALLDLAELRLRAGDEQTAHNMEKEAEHLKCDPKPWQDMWKRYNQ